MLEAAKSEFEEDTMDSRISAGTADDETDVPYFYANENCKTHADLLAAFALYVERREREKQWKKMAWLKSAAPVGGRAARRRGWLI